MQTVIAGGIESPHRAGEAGLAVNESSVSAVSWPAVFGGTFVALSVSLILLALGSGFGLASLSPWSESGASATTFTVMTAIGLIVVQWVSSGVGGYITGRLRTKWVGVHTHEVFFRDTAHGFLTWALATVVGVVLLTSAVSSVVSGGVHAAATVASGAARGAGQAASAAVGPAMVSGYDVDRLFRADKPAAAAASGVSTTGGGSTGTNAASGPAGATSQNVSGEATRILEAAITSGEMPAADRTYLAQLVASRTGVSQADAEKRVDDLIASEKAAEAKAKQAADTARKAASAMSFATALSMLIGAFIACAAAAVGGQQRDLH